MRCMSRRPSVILSHISVAAVPFVGIEPDLTTFADQPMFTLWLLGCRLEQWARLTAGTEGMYIATTFKN